MKIKAFAIIIAAASFLCAAAAAQTLDASLSVYEDSVIKAADKRFLGVGEDWQATTDSIHVGNKGSNDLAEDFPAAAKNTGFDIPYMRMAGGSANSFYWKDGADKFENRGYTYYKKPIYYGIAEWIKNAQQINPGVELTFVVNLSDTLENSKDLVRFLTLMPDNENAVGSDGINWAQRRIDCGIKEPVNIKTFELGNELDKFSPCYPSEAECRSAADEYTQKCAAVIEAMSSVNAEIRFAAHAKTYPAEKPAIAAVWNDRVIHNLAGKISYIALHDYYYPSSFFWFKYARIKDEIVTKTYDLPEEQRPHVLVTEHAVWANPEGENDPKRLVTSLSGALATGAFINLASQIGEIDGINYYGLTAGTASQEDYGGMSMGIFRRFYDGKIYLTGIGEAYKTLSAGWGDNIVSSSVSGNNYLGDNADGLAMISSAHTVNDGSLYLIFVNQSTQYAQRVSVSAQGSYKLYKEYILTGDSLYSDNNPETSEGLFMKTRLIKSQTRLTSYTVPEKTMAVLHLVPEDRVYEEDKNAEFAVNQEKNGVLDVQCTLYDNKPLANYRHFAVFAVKSGDEHAIKNAVWFGQAEAERQRACFKVNMPKACRPGSYDIVLAAGGNYAYTTVEYGGAKSVSIEKLSASTIGDRLTVNIGFSDKFPSAKKYRIAVCRESESLAAAFESGSVVYLGEFSKSDGDVKEIQMPGLADNGRYTVYLTYEPLYGEKTDTKAADFDYSGSVLPLTSSGKITNQSGDTVTYENLAETDTVNFSVTNTADNNIKGKIIVCGYDASGRLIYSKTSEEVTFKKGTETASVGTDFTGLEIGSLKIYIWESVGGAKPLSRNIILSGGTEEQHAKNN